MKKRMKALVTCTLVFCMLLLCTLSSSAKENAITEVTSAPGTYRFTQEAQPLVGRGAISISQAVLREGGKDLPVYLIALHGTENTAYGQADEGKFNMSATQMGRENAYTKAIASAMKETIPKDSNIVFAGHSFGGMVAQQVAADTEIQERYNILHIVCYGSPLVCKDEVEGDLHRLCDKYDFVPFETMYTFTDPDAQFNDRSVEAESELPGYVHYSSYWSEDTWGDYDAVGIKGGNAKLYVDESTTTYFDAPFIAGTKTHFKAWASIKIGINDIGIAIQF